MSSGPNYAFSTPQNTPANNAPISSRAQQPNLGSVREESDTDKAAAAAMFAQHPQLVSMIQNKLGTLVGRSSGYVESLPANVRRRVAGLKGVQKEHAKLEAQFQEEVLQLEKKYFAKFTPLYEKRHDIVNGKKEPTEEEVTIGNQKDDADEDDGEEGVKSDEEPAPEEKEEDPSMIGIPEFWLTAMKTEPNLAAMITERDEAALKHVTDIRMEYLDKPGFRLIFEFAENEFFSNKILTKTYYYQEETGYGGDFVYDHADGDKISWKSEKDLTLRIEQKKQRNKNTKQTRVIKKSVPTDSFFNFFRPPQPPPDDIKPADVIPDIEDRLELDYSLGEEIKEKLIPRAIDWFTGDALKFEGLTEDDDLDDGEFEDEDDEDEDDLGEDEDEDESEEEENDGPRSQKQDTAECKQS